MTPARSFLFPHAICPPDYSTQAMHTWRSRAHSTNLKHSFLYPQLHTLLLVNFMFRNRLLFDSIRLNCRRDVATHDAIRMNSKNCWHFIVAATLLPFSFFDRKLNWFIFLFFSFRFWFIGSPGILNSPPPSPSCSHPNANGDVFFPRGNSSNNGSASSSSSVQPSTPSSIRMHDDYRSAQWSPRSSVSVPRRR